MKTAGIILIAAGILLSGREWEKRKRSCVRELERYLRLLSYLEQEITYRQTPRPSALKSFMSYGEGIAAEFAEKVREGLIQSRKSMPEIWEEAAELYHGLGFTAEELGRIRQAGTAFSLPRREMIGCQSRTDQKYLQQLLEARRSGLEKDCRLFRWLSVMASLLAVILLM